MIPIPPPFDEDNQEARRCARAVVATVTNSQQKGGEEPCATPTLSEASKHCASSAAPTSDPEGAATLRSASYSAESVAFWSKSLPAVQGLWWWWNEDEDSLPIPVSIMYSGTSDSYFASEGQWGWTRFQNVEDMGGFWMRCYEPLSPTTREQVQTSPTPSPTLEKLAQEIDDLYEAPSRIRLLRRILEREFGVSRSVAETAKAKEIASELAEKDYREYAAKLIEPILSRFRERELRELREECERLRKDKERLDWMESDEGFTILPTCGVPEGRRKEPTPLRVAIDAAMQPSAQSK